MPFHASPNPLPTCCAKSANRTSVFPPPLLPSRRSSSSGQVRTSSCPLDCGRHATAGGLSATAGIGPALLRSGCGFSLLRFRSSFPLFNSHAGWNHHHATLDLAGVFQVKFLAVDLGEMGL